MDVDVLRRTKLLNHRECCRQNSKRQNSRLQAIKLSLLQDCIQVVICKSLPCLIQDIVAAQLSKNKTCRAFDRVVEVMKLYSPVGDNFTHCWIVGRRGSRLP